MRRSGDVLKVASVIKAFDKTDQSNDNILGSSWWKLTRFPFFFYHGMIKECKKKVNCTDLFIVVFPSRSKVVWLYIDDQQANKHGVS